MWGGEVQEQVGGVWWRCRCRPEVFGGGAGAGQRCGDHKMLVPHLSALLWCVSVVGGRINNSMVNFAGCEVGGCEEVRCGDGTLAPALPGRCCGDRR